MFASFLRWLTADFTGALTRAYEMKLKAENDEQRLIADTAIADITRQIDAASNAREIRLASAGFWEMRLITSIIAGCFALHLLLVTLDTCFALGWKIAKFPAPFDEWQGAILLSFFGIQAVGGGLNAIAAAIRGRK
ncbi:hypothetical protein [Ochrobactrum chromiisoli]|uniref:Holin of 3TMs, for gene-transfer release n=1 Tax=Ochrobactrum chromiisoli TaxID=2993941 RepID=A0ABT3QN92_9HYPH|nr:hypothetical protein [Ochrobactrum chromiisoli]MCX2697060.1 hypothetical protein [Ochrobactrum chromiisoli]